ncbi:unnamed protein product [Rotaria sp. Silwood1]|nr:unnamed protein product [Rotaria sp. Silwood1]CAF4067804.1 unnamed protein product [Rotaria sp. Silwood1]CAF5068269.1 unnamed protein product [Rotaria sp. Silwood1]
MLNKATILIAHIQTHIFDFQWVFKHDFDLIRQQYLPLIIDRIIALHLANDDATPCQIDLFLSDDYTLQRFINLQSLSFYNICSNKLLTKIIFQCRHLPHLIRLQFIKCFFDQCSKIHYDFINDIWTLPKLTHCILDINFEYNDQNFMPTLSSKSITYVSIPYMYRTLNQFGELFERTPNIHQLNARLKSDGNDQQFETSV